MLLQPTMNSKPKGTEQRQHWGSLANAVNLGTPSCLRLLGDVAGLMRGFAGQAASLGGDPGVPETWVPATHKGHICDRDVQ